MKISMDSWSKKPNEIKTITIICGVTAFLLLFVGLAGLTGVISYSDGFTFISGMVAGIFGILIGFSLDRMNDRANEEKIKQTSLKLIFDELTKLKNTADKKPDDFAFVRFHTNIWDSIVSSGNLCLLDYEQIVKLSQVYSDIKSALIDSESIKAISKEIEEILKKKWWNPVIAKT